LIEINDLLSWIVDTWGMRDEGEYLREQLERYRRLHALNSDPHARRVLEQLIEEAETKLRATKNVER